jgi:hypothetical protein
MIVGRHLMTGLSTALNSSLNFFFFVARGMMDLKRGGMRR